MSIQPELKTVLKRLRLSPMLATLPDRLAYARKEKLDYAQFLELVLSDEVERRDGRVLPLLLVADDSLDHRPAHRLRGLRDGVAAKVDHARTVPAGRTRRNRPGARASSRYTQPETASATATARSNSMASQIARSASTACSCLSMEAPSTIR